MGAQGSAEKGHIGRGFRAILHVYRRRWFQVYVSGLVLLALMEVSYLIANNNLIPGIII